MDKTIRQLYKEELKNKGIDTKVSKWYAGRMKCYTKEIVSQDGVELTRNVYKEYTNSHNRRFPNDSKKKIEVLQVYCNGYISKEDAQKIADKLLATYHRAFTKTEIYIYG